ncbi:MULTISPECIES: hypothetical protein [unclassified Streptomyces]|uniref:hypothetical protein n=1 Tax=Streptomyces TaxID=1883 RepID=UPI000B8DA987|nr:MULTISPECIES: hypothetical protein [unclassified Streptomyces]ASQ94436.1 hypothetical protein CGL27_16360 [Streptomyces sp. 11-1-2]RSS33678.1 hypothetical protein EF902_42850 [Streptomyces sp. WAC05858]
MSSELAELTNLLEAALTDTLTPAPDAYVVVAEVIHGPHLAPRLGDGLFCSAKCAEYGVRKLVRELRREEGGSGFVLPHEGRLIGCVVTRGSRMWSVQILARSELPTV